MIEIPPIRSKQEITGLIRDYQETKDIKARDKVVMNNIKLVYSIASKYSCQDQSNGYTFDDFVSEGVIGLIKAVDHFDVDRDINFTTYAYWWILKGITKTITRGTLNLPPHRIKLYNRYEEMSKAYTDKGIPPDMKEIAKKLKVSERILIDTIGQRDAFSLDSSLFVSDINSRGRDVEDQIIAKMDFTKIWNTAKKELKHEQIRVVEGRFGLHGPEKTLQEMSDDMHISKEYVRKLQQSAVEKMKSISKRNRWQ